MVVVPDDEHNRRLVDAVHPAEWRSPSADERPELYDLVVIGAGTAGLVSAGGAAGVGARVALIERHLMGGDCLNVGCVPSKALLRCARAAAEARRASAYGVRTGEITVDFPAIMERMRALRADIAPVDGAARFRNRGVDIYLGDARFVSPREVYVSGAGEGHRLRFARAIIATGGRTAVPAIPGLEAAGYLTAETVFSLTELPARLLVVGGGPVGCELAQCFARFGAAVTLVQKADALLAKEEPDAAAIVAEQLISDGVTVHTGAELMRVDLDGDRDSDGSDGSASLTRLARLRTRAGEESVAVDAILVATGRRANVDGLGLDLAEVGFDTSGVHVDDRLCTRNRRIFAVGDVASAHKFTHAADAGARLALRNALFFGRQRMSALVIPRVTYTDPEIAACGLTAAEAEAAGVAIATYELTLGEVDRAIVDGETDGLVRVHVRRGSDTIVGATIVAPHAGELIGELSLAMSRGIGLGALGAVIHPYPTVALALRQVADQYMHTRFTPLVARILGWVLALRRR
ncbi:pyridine nucleotide-disulphide oxidoreductase dimerization region [Haliangium ochraceum DSM 14365]|uniref:Pyridine nucleotide-disulphide oxidoreductase dimerization region n=2 Tax=Haliangium ochraceum TaxID=80816 RepID=D0LQH5_HALO1|nr:pyridine nucleotide-disulphide oxidoreductase dimerization region [Haliangium ochraceum DSM 14365]